MVQFNHGSGFCIMLAFAIAFWRVISESKTSRLGARVFTPTSLLLLTSFLTNTTLNLPGYLRLTIKFDTLQSEYSLVHKNITSSHYKNTSHLYNGET